VVCAWAVPATAVIAAMTKSFVTFMNISSLREMIGGYFWEAGLHIGFETLPGVPVRTVVGNAQAMSSLS
jgi:hypothetical protein